MRRHSLISLALILLLGLMVVACGGTPSPTASPPTAATQPTTATQPTAATQPTTATQPTASSAGTTGKVDLSMFVFAAPGHKDIPRDVSNAFTAKNTNVSVQITEGSNAQTMPQMLAAFKTTPDKPLFDLGYYNQTAHTQGELAGLWETIDINNVPNAKNILPQFRQPEDRGIAFATGYFGIVYNTNFIKEPPTTYADLWDPKYKGHVAMWDYQWYMVLVAAKLNGGDENNIDPGFKIWSEHADQLHSLVTSNQQLKDAMVSGDVWISVFDIQQVRIWHEQEGAPVAGAIPKEGAIAWPLYLNITKGVTPAEKLAAEQLINELIAPETLATYAAKTYYAPTVTGVTLPPELAGVPSMDPEVLKNALVFDWATVNKNNDAWSQRWDREVKSKLR